MVAALWIAGRENQKAWNLKSVQLESWTATLDKHLRNMFSHVRDGARRLSSGPWVRSLPWTTSAAKCDDSVSDAQSRSQQFESRSSCILELEPTWNCGFSVDLMLPWRSSGDSSGKAFGIPLDLAAIVLRRRTLSSQAGQMSTHVLCAVSPTRRSSRSSSGPLRASSQKHCGVKNAKIAIIDFVLCQRVDKCLLVSFYEQSRQICQ